MSRRLVGLQRFAVGLLGPALLAASGSAPGAGFALSEQGTRALGAALAGTGTGTEELSAAFWNPAGMAADPRPGVGVGVAVIHPSVEFSGQSPDGGNGGVDAFPPRLFARFPRFGEWTVGMALNAPFGLETSWDPGWAGRYHAIDSELEVTQWTLSMARPLGERFFVGGGLVVQRAEARLTNAVFQGMGVPDGFSRVSGDSTGAGFVLGALWRGNDTRIGLAYHSSVEHELVGINRLELAGGATVQPARADLEVPGRIVAGIRRQVGESWQVMAGATWTQWHTFDELRVRFPGSPRPDSVVEKNWKSVWSGSVGAEYRVRPGLTLRAGYRFENSPVPDPAHRSPRIPDSDRHRLGVGASYAWGDGWSLDLAYAYLAFEDAPVNNTHRSTGTTLRGRFDSHAHVLDLQLNRRF